MIHIRNEQTISILSEDCLAVPVHFTLDDIVRLEWSIKKYL